MLLDLVRSASCCFAYAAWAVAVGFLVRVGSASGSMLRRGFFTAFRELLKDIRNMGITVSCDSHRQMA